MLKNRLCDDGANGGTWTRMAVKPSDFKSDVYTNSTTLAQNNVEKLRALYIWFDMATSPAPEVINVTETFYLLMIGPR